MGKYDEMMKQEEKEKNESKVEKIRDTYNAMVDKQQEVSEKAFNWFQKYGTQIIMVISSFLMIGIQQFAEPQFDPYFFMIAKFWCEYLPFITATWLILFATTTGAFKIYMEIDHSYTELESQIQDHVNEDSKNPFIKKGALLEDRENKKRAYKRKLSRELSKKMKKYGIGTFDVLVIYLGLVEPKKDDDGNIGISTELLLKGIKIKPKRENAVKGSLQALYEMLSDEYLEANIDNVRIKYTQVTPTLLTHGFSPRTKETYEPNYQANDKSQIIQEFGVGQIATMIIMFVLLSLDLVSKETSWATWVFFGLKAFQLLWAYLKGSARAKVLFKRTHVKALQERANSLNEYRRQFGKKKEEVVS